MGKWTLCMQVYLLCLRTMHICSCILFTETNLEMCIPDFFFCGAATQRGSWPPHSWGFLDHTQRRATVGRTPLDEWSARRRDLYLTTHNRQISMPLVGFEPTISAGEQPQTYASDRAATGTGIPKFYVYEIKNKTKPWPLAEQRNTEMYVKLLPIWNSGMKKRHFDK